MSGGDCALTPREVNKSIINRATEESIETVIDREAELQQRAVNSADQKEAVAAFQRFFSRKKG